MQQKRNISFKIQSMDSLGQGVSKETDKITFIAKTLPGESGEAEIYSAKKGVQFANLKSLAVSSPSRISPLCPHFDHCPSCHFLHTSYEEEIKFKTQNLEKLFQKIPHPDIQVTPAVRRVGYRNRLQLHYDLRARKLGMLDVKNQQIAPIPNCLIANPQVSEEIKRLYHQESWIARVGQHQPNQGHLEIYDLNNEIKVSVNRPYAEGGFTQVFDEMNQAMKEKLTRWSKQFPAEDLLDLFAGNGNLSKNMNHSKRLCVDVYQEKSTDPFLSQDLYAPEAMQKVKAKVAAMKLHPSLLVIDPPRSGLKNFEAWLGEFSPKRVAYVSCDPHTLVRDMMPVKNYRVTELHLVDFFPSTFHFETVAFLERT
jgi:23S rRNA (uracil1939-C5)-methyltransferase